MRRGYFWGLVIILMLAAGGAVGAIATDVFLRPTYESSALIRIRAVLPQLTGEPQVMPDFENYCQSRVEAVRSRRVIDQAMQRPVWTKLMRETGDEAVASFTRSVRVEHPRNSEMIRITFTDRTPDGAAAGATAVAEALTAISEEEERAKAGNQNLALVMTSRIQVMRLGATPVQPTFNRGKIIALGVAAIAGLLVLICFRMPPPTIRSTSHAR